MIKVNEVMSNHVITLAPDDNLQNAKELMSANTIRHIPIVSNTMDVVGLVSQRDVLKATASSVDNDHTINESSVPIAKIMTANIKTIHPDERLLAAGLLMEKHKYGCLPVVNDSKLVGIITDTDFVGVAINLIEQMEHYEELE